jgi:hypothetical protein
LELLSRSFAFREGARFTGLLGPAFFQDLADSHKLRFGDAPRHTYNLPLTLWACLSQVLSASKSCAAAAARVLVLCVSLRLGIPSTSSGGYWKAKAKIPAPFLRELAVQLATQVEAAAPDGWRWKGHSVKVADATLVGLQDSDANLKDYPQQRSQKPGTATTRMRLMLLLALATGVALGAAEGPYRGKGSGELSLLGQLLGAFGPGDLLLADRQLGTFAVFALLLAQGAHGCARLNTSHYRPPPAGHDDVLVTWKKGKRPAWVDEETWDALPDQLAVRVVRYRVSRPGWRSREVCLATTLLDARAYTKEELAALYLDRWNGELDIRAIKQTLGMHTLAAKTPQAARAELWAHLLGYNLTRTVMAQAALDRGLLPRQLSFAGAARTLCEFRWLLCCSGHERGQLAEVISAALASHRVGSRPGRYEPREVKHRRRKYLTLREPRRRRRQQLARAGAGDSEAKAKGGRGAGPPRPARPAGPAGAPPA